MSKPSGLTAIAVYAKKTSKNSIVDYGGPDKFLTEIKFLLGMFFSLFKSVITVYRSHINARRESALRRMMAIHLASIWILSIWALSRECAGDNVWQGATRSEGGFKSGQVSYYNHLSSFSHIEAFYWCREDQMNWLASMRLKKLAVTAQALLLLDLAGVKCFYLRRRAGHRKGWQASLSAARPHPLR